MAGQNSIYIMSHPCLCDKMMSVDVSEYKISRALDERETGSLEPLGCRETGTLAGVLDRWSGRLSAER